MSQTTVDTDIDLPLDEPATTPARRHRPSRGDTSLSGLLLAYAVVLAITALFAGFLGAISGDML